MAKRSRKALPVPCRHKFATRIPAAAENNERLSVLGHINKPLCFAAALGPVRYGRAGQAFAKSGAAARLVRSTHWEMKPDQNLSGRITSTVECSTTSP